MPDVGTDPDIPNGRIWCIPERAGEAGSGAGTLERRTGHDTGDLKFVVGSSEPDVTL